MEPMSLSMEQRMKLASEASRDRAFARLAEADAKFDDAIQWAVCPCAKCQANRSGARLLKAKPLTNRKVLGRVGVLLLAASVLAIFLLLKGLPFLRALNY